MRGVRSKIALYMVVLLALPFSTVAQEQSQGDEALPSGSYLPGVWHTYQMWNNCGPANLTMSLSYWGHYTDQEYVASYLKPDIEDKNVSPWEMVAYVNEEIPNLRAVLRYAGDITLIKRLIFNGYPVLIETGFNPEDEGLGWMGHYRLIVGYSDPDANFYIFDSYLGYGNALGIQVSYAEIDADWRHFRRPYVITYPPEQEDHLAAVLGEDWDATANAWHALAVYEEEARLDPEDAFAWFNVGASHVALGQYEEAARAYDRARRLGLPWRMLWYQFEIFEAYLQTGRLDDVTALVNVNLKRTPYVEEWYYYRGMVHMQRGELAAAVNAFAEALRHNPNDVEAREALRMAAGEVTWHPEAMFAR